MASMLVPNAVKASLKKECLDSTSAVSSLGFSPSYSMCRPSAKSMTNATQWSHASIKDASIKDVAEWPINQPIIGVIASMVPKITPILKASVKRGFLRIAPLLIATEKASVDIEKASSRSAIGFMWFSLVEYRVHDIATPPTCSVDISMVSPTERCSHHGMWPSVLIRTLSQYESRLLPKECLD